MVWMFWIVFWSICLSPFLSVLNEQNIKSSWFIVWFKLFSIFCIWRKIYIFSLILAYKGRSLYYSLWIILICSWFSATVIAYWKQLSSIFFGFIFAFLHPIYLGESLYDPPWLMTILLHRWCIPETQSKITVATLHGLF